jgi:hypothetical protein
VREGDGEAVKGFSNKASAETCTPGEAPPVGAGTRLLLIGAQVPLARWKFTGLAYWNDVFVPSAFA